MLFYIRYNGPTPLVINTDKFKNLGWAYSFNSEGGPFTDMCQSDTLTIDSSSQVFFKGKGTPNCYDERTENPTNPMVYDWFNLASLDSRALVEIGGSLQTLVWDGHINDDVKRSEERLWEYFIFLGMFGTNIGEIGCTLDIRTLQLNNKLCPFYYYGLFWNCKDIANIPADLLPARELSDFCYQNMFRGTGLTSIPKDFLPATSLAEYCYLTMFYQCKNLTSINCALPATSLPYGCYFGMFAKSAVESFPANLLANVTAFGESSCSDFFEGSSIISIPDGFFPKDNGITYGSGCFSNFMSNCENLNEIYVPFVTWDGHNTQSWVDGVPGIGDFYCLKSLPETYGKNNIPIGWTIHHTDPVSGKGSATIAKVARFSLH